MNRKTNPVSNTDTPTTENTEIVNNAKSQCAQMRGIALSSIGQNINCLLSRVISPDGLNSRFDSALDLKWTIQEMNKIVKILLCDSFWLDDRTENRSILDGSRRANKNEFLLVLRDLASACSDIDEMIEEALA